MLLDKTPALVNGGMIPVLPNLLPAQAAMARRIAFVEDGVLEHVWKLFYAHTVGILSPFPCRFFLMYGCSPIVLGYSL